MKKFSLLLAILPFLVACGNQATPKETSAQKTIVLATAGDVPPFDYEDKGNLTGFDIEVLKAVDEKLSDYEIQFQRTAWESIFPGLDSGHYQAAANN